MRSKATADATSSQKSSLAGMLRKFEIFLIVAAGVWEKLAKKKEYYEDIERQIDNEKGRNGKKKGVGE